MAIRSDQLILFDSDSDEKETQPVPKVMGYAKSIISKFSDGQFHFHCRITTQSRRLTSKIA